MARVLYIDADVGRQGAVRDALSAAGHEVHLATDGVEGLRLAGAMAPEIALVDLAVPGLDGHAVALRLRALPSLERLPLAAVAGPTERETALAVGFDAVLEAPIAPSRLAETLAELLRPRGDRSLADSPLGTAAARLASRLEGAAHELAQAHERLEEAAKLRREFLRNLSHELATPMTPVVGYLKLLVSEELGPLSPIQQKALVAIDAATCRLRTLVDTLLDVSSLESGRLHFYRRDYDFAKIAKRAIDESRARFADRGVALRETRASGPMPATGDPDKLRRAITHVLDNAAKFTPPGSDVAVLVGVADDGESYEVVVADSGPGIPASLLSRVLEPFYQADGSLTRVHGGVGLGLAFARRVAEAMGGHVTVASPPVRGLLDAQSGAEITIRVHPRPSLPVPQDL